MDRFVPALRRVARELDLPPGARSRILMEMAADLEAAYAHHRRRGAGEDEAARAAEAAVLGSPEVIRRLGRLHLESWQRWSKSMGFRLSGGADLVMLVVGVGPVLILAGTVAARVVGGAVGPLAWILIAVGLALAGLVVVEVIGIARGTPGRTRSLPLLLVLSAAAPAVGLLAPVLGLYAVSTSLAQGVPDGAAQVALVAQVGRDGALLLIGLLLGIAGVLAWFILLNRASLQAEREVDAMLAGELPPDPGARGRGILPLVNRRRA